MMGSSHALSGAAVWLAGSLALEHFAGYHQGPLQIAVGTAICAGGALLPDMDLSGRVTTNRGGATVARTFGIVSLFAAEVVEKVSLGVYRMTRWRADPKRSYGHRTLTHTLIFNVGIGWLTTMLCAAYGRWAVLGVLFVCFGMALRGLFDDWAQRAGWVVITGTSAIAAIEAYRYLPADRGYPMLGLAVGVGGLVHVLGDMITKHGCPVLWPIPIGRRLWYCVGLPPGLSIKAGGTVERVFLRSVFTLVALGAALALVGGDLIRHWDALRLYAGR